MILINILIKSISRGSRGPHGMGDLLELALLSFEFYPRPYALGPRLKLFKSAPLCFTEPKAIMKKEFYDE